MRSVVARRPAACGWKLAVKLVCPVLAGRLVMSPVLFNTKSVAWVPTQAMLLSVSAASPRFLITKVFAGLIAWRFSVPKSVFAAALSLHSTASRGAAASV